MIMGMSFVSVWVLDQDSAKEFYTQKLGCELTNDLKLDNGMDPAHSMLDGPTGEQVRALVAKGALSPGVMSTSDCRRDHAALSALGVQFLQEPAVRPYGVEAILRDDSGNWYSFTQRTA
jgi:catechol 2,3-dioxygenase-like lactoylglutathione lyase family enzyme